MAEGFIQKPGPLSSGKGLVPGGGPCDIGVVVAVAGVLSSMSRFAATAVVAVATAIIGMVGNAAAYAEGGTAS